ncbi:MULTISPECIES: DUF4870 domain-containing protein [Virgibacillus]|uniref:DUF4870 domain-containing protein n=1 Tax=Virgibacillus TaxID=84406 RepID=UPI0009DC3F11|nr:DUF4870 domain-containing protein [Virgibacillus massiliensis]MYL40681.1 DUF4870 domain-containing protein [Virgibacillus massiliensis]
MKAEKLLSSLCYFSIFFAPFLFPIIIYVLTSGIVRHHAGKSLWIHLVPYLSFFIGIGVLVLNGGNQMSSLIIICIFTVIGVYYLILNFVRGIKVLIVN